MNALAPLTLPSTGEQVVEGRQYVLDRYARNMVREGFGLQPPQVVVALYKKRPAERATIHVENLETHEVRTSIEERPAVPATFYYFTGTHKIRFSLSLESLAEVRALNADADKFVETGPKAVREPKQKKTNAIPSALADLIASL